MKRSHLKALAIKSKKPEDRVNYKRQRNFVVQLNKIAKKSFFSKNSHKSKHFWDAIKTTFSDKNCKAEGRIQLLENDVLNTSDENVADIFNSNFNRITETYEIPTWENPFSDLSSCEPHKKFANHPNIKSIISHMNTDKKFNFSQVQESEVLKAISSLNNLNQSVDLYQLVHLRLLQISVLHS